MMHSGDMNEMMQFMFGYGLLGLIISILVIVVLILLAIYLWKQIQKK